MGAGHGVFTEPAEGTAKDLRFTRSKDKKCLYAIILGWPGENEVVSIAALSLRIISQKDISKIELLAATAGNYLPLTYLLDNKGLHITMPEKPSEEMAYVIKITFTGTMPQIISSAGQGSLNVKQK